MERETNQPKQATRDMRTGIDLISAERKRQIEKEGWTPEHDDQHSDRSLAIAAACYALGEDSVFIKPTGNRGRSLPNVGEVEWPWHPEWYKPKDAISDLTKAGALIAAEIDRLKRQEPSEPAPTSPQQPTEAQGWSKEPWHVAFNPGGPEDQPLFPSIRNATGLPNGEDIVAMPLGTPEIVKANAKRIVECVNFCEGLSSERIAALMAKGVKTSHSIEYADKYESKLQTANAGLDLIYSASGQERGTPETVVAGIQNMRRVIDERTMELREANARVKELEEENKRLSELNDEMKSMLTWSKQLLKKGGRRNDKRRTT